MKIPGDAKIIVGTSAHLSQIETGSVRLLFESPPYEKMVKCCGETACLSSHAAEDFVEEFKRFLAERLRVLAKDGNYVVNLQPQVIEGFTSPTEYLIPQAVVAAGFKLVQTHTWAKTNAAPFAPDRRLKNSSEFFWHFAKTDRYFFDKDAAREPSVWAARDHRQERYNVLGKDPGTVFFMPKSQDQTSSGHPAKMKDGVASRFIKLLSAPGDLVADGFAGTGQTGLEALALGRRFVGYELHAARAEQACGRLGIGKSEQEDSEMKPWMSAKEVAAYAGLSVATIYSKTSRGEVPVHHIGRLPRYHRDEIDSWIRGVKIEVPIQPAQDCAKES